jgi:hypothetical protein
MKKKSSSIRIIIIFLVSVMFSKLYSQKNEILGLIGPSFHFNFEKGGKMKFSGGLEFSGWFVKNKGGPGGPGFDVGIEFEQGKIRLYSEAQYGLIVGASAGPVLQYSFSDKKICTGFQTSVWLSFFLGGEIRGRFMQDGIYYSPGVFVKLPTNLGAFRLPF